MYNIDFRVSGQIVSIPVCLNDTLNTLISRMKGLEPFRKYTDSQLEEKLVKCLKQIVNGKIIDTKIKQRVKDLLKNISNGNRIR